jgi:hypothetical protein
VVTSRHFLKKERKVLFSLQALEQANAVLVSNELSSDEAATIVQRLGVEILGRPKDAVSTVEYAIKKARAIVEELKLTSKVNPQLLAHIVVQAVGDTRADTTITKFLADPKVLEGLRRSGALLREGSLEKRFSLFKRGTWPSIKDFIPWFRAQALRTA